MAFLLEKYLLVDNNHRCLEGSHSYQPGPALTPRTPHLLNLFLFAPSKARVAFLQLPYASLVCNSGYYLKNTPNMYAFSKEHHHELWSPSNSRHLCRNCRDGNEFDLQVGP